MIHWDKGQREYGSYIFFFWQCLTLLAHDSTSELTTDCQELLQCEHRQFAQIHRKPGLFRSAACGTDSIFVAAFAYQYRIKQYLPSSKTLLSRYDSIHL